MVVSSACMMVAVMAQIVTMFRRRPGTATGAAAVVFMALVLFCRHRRREAEQRRERPAMAGVDRGIGAHAGLQLLYVLVMAVEIDSHRHALHHLDEVSGGVLRRQDREWRAGARAQRTYDSLEHMIGERVNVDSDRLSHRDIGEIRFLRIGVDPGLRGVYDGGYRRAGGVRAGGLYLQGQ